MNKLTRLLWLIAIAPLFTFQSCALFRSLVVEDDIVYGTKRIRTDYSYNMARESYSPLIQMEQTITKETDAHSVDQYHVYDRISLKANSYRLDNRVFILVDRTAFPVKLESMEFDRDSKIVEKRKDVMTVDSSKVSVVTGYEQNQSHVFRLSYTIDSNVIEKIKTAQKVSFRYYSGPDMITIRMSTFDLKTFRKMMEMH